MNRLIEWSHFETRTEQGTLLIHSTISKVLLDLDSWAFYERTGAAMPVGRSKYMVAWRSLLKSFGMLADDGALSIDRKEIFNKLEDDLKGWEKEYEYTRHMGTAKNQPTLNAATLKSVAAAMHKVFMARKNNEIEIGILAAYCAGIEGDPEEWKGNIRAAARMLPNVFAVGAGGAPRVRRLLDSKGKATGLTPFDPRKPRGPNGTTTSNPKKMYERISKTTREWGFNEVTFKQALKELGVQSASEAELKGWLAAREEDEEEETEAKETYVEEEDNAQ